MKLKLGQSKKSYFVIVAAVAIVAVGGVVTKALFLGGSGTPLSSGDIDLQRGLVGWWKLDGNGKDATPYSDNGVATGVPTAVTDREGAASSASTFDGSTSYYTVANSPTLQVTGSETISFWIKPASFSSRQNPVCKAYGGEGCITQETGGALTYYYGTAGSNTSPYQQIGTGNVLSVGTWTHVAIVRDLSSMTLKWYVNGAQKASATAAYAAATAGTNSLYIGNGYAGRYNGTIDDVRLYNRALSVNEVSALYNEYNSGLNLDSGQSGLIGWWKLDGNAKDSTPYGNDGTLVGGPASVSDRKNKSIGAMSFDGTSNYISVPNFDFGVLRSSSFNANWTLSIWAKAAGTNGNEKVIIGRQGCNGGIYTYNNKYAFAIKGSACWTGAQTIYGGVLDSNWHLLTATYQAGAMTFYEDGVSQGTAVLANMNNYGTTLGIGSTGTSNTYDFSGTLDDARVYNRALSAQEVSNLYSSYDPSASLYSSSGSGGQSVNLSQGLVGEWGFNGNARDATPYGDNGTVSGATLTNDRKGRANSAYLLGDSGAWINVGSPSILNGANGFSYNIWLMRTGGSVYHWPEIMGSSNTHTYYGIRSGNYGDSIYFEYGKSPYDGSTFAGTSGNTLPVNEWHMYTVTYDGSTLKTYWDGVLKQTVASVTLNPSYGGMSFTTATNAWNGSIDDAKAWNRALSQNEVTALYSLYQ